MKFFKRHWRVLALLLAVRIALPWVGLAVLNQKLAHDLGDFAGHAGDLDLSLFRLAVRIQDLEISKRGDSYPLLQARTLELGISLRALWARHLAWNVTLAGMELAPVLGRPLPVSAGGSKESGKGSVPRIASFQVRDSRIIVRHDSLPRQVFLSIDRLDIEGPDPFELRAMIQGDAELFVTGKTSVDASPPFADLDFSLKNFQAYKVNSLLRLYIPLDITSGTVSLFGEVAATPRNAVGYVKFFFENGDVIAPNQHFLSPRHFLAEIVSAFANWLLKNNRNKKLATVIPIRVRSQKLELDVGKVFGEALKNTVQPIEPGVDHTVDVQLLKR